MCIENNALHLFGKYDQQNLKSNFIETIKVRNFYVFKQIKKINNFNDVYKV